MADNTPHPNATNTRTPDNMDIKVAVGIGQGFEEVDEEDEVSTEAGNQSEGMLPYRKFGVGFLFVAVIVAVLITAVPMSVKERLSNTDNGYLFHSLIAVFLAFLFSCLCCTFFLGGSRETWEDPIFLGIHLNFVNTTAIMGLLIEFVQVCSFSFNYRATFTGSSRLIQMQYLSLPFSPGDVFKIMYWIIFVIAFSPYIFVVTVRMIIYTINRRSGETEAANFVQKYQQKIYSILWFLVNTMYMPVIGTMMSGIDCTFRTTIINGNKVYSTTLDSDQRIVCLTREHLPYIICSLIALIIYYPAASFAQAQTQNISDIKFKPKIVFIFVQCKVLLVAVDVYFTDYTTAYFVVVLVVDLVFLGVNLWKSPCLVQWVNQLRTIFFIISTISTFASFISTAPNINSNAPLAILVIGWAATAIGLPLFFVTYQKIISLANKKNSKV